MSCHVMSCHVMSCLKVCTITTIVVNSTIYKYHATGLTFITFRHVILRTSYCYVINNL